MVIQASILGLRKVIAKKGFIAEEPQHQILAFRQVFVRATTTMEAVTMQEDDVAWFDVKSCNVPRSRIFFDISRNVGESGKIAGVAPERIRWISGIKCRPVLHDAFV